MSESFKYNPYSQKLRKDLGLSPDSSIDEVYDGLRNKYGLPPDSTVQQVNEAILFGIRDDLLDLNDAINQAAKKKNEMENATITEKNRSTLGKIAAFLSLRK